MIAFMIFLAIIYFLFAVVAIQNQLFIGYILRPPGVDCGTLTAHMQHQHLANMAYAEDRILDAAAAVINPFKDGQGFLPDLNG